MQTKPPVRIELGSLTLCGSGCIKPKLDEYFPRQSLYFITDLRWCNFQIESHHALMTQCIVSSQPIYYKVFCCNPFILPVIPSLPLDILQQEFGVFFSPQMSYESWCSSTQSFVKSWAEYDDVSEASKIRSQVFRRYIIHQRNLLEQFILSTWSIKVLK